MKKLLSIALAASLLFVFGCAKSGPATTTAPTTAGQETAERQTYTNKQYGFSIQFPGIRTFQENVFNAAVMFFTPQTEGDKIQENIGITASELQGQYTLDEFYAKNQETLKQQESYKELENTTIKVNDVDAKKSIFTTAVNSNNLKFEEVMIIKGKMVYVITYTALESTFDQFAQKFDEMVATFEIK